MRHRLPDSNSSMNETGAGNWWGVFLRQKNTDHRAECWMTTANAEQKTLLGWNKNITLGYTHLLTTSKTII